MFVRVNMSKVYVLIGVDILVEILWKSRFVELIEVLFFVRKFVKFVCDCV